MLNQDFAPDERVLAQEILGYLCEHPDARGSEEQVADWWIRRQRLEEGVRAVRRVLGRLVEEGLVIEYQRPNATCDYGLNRERLEDAFDFITGEQDVE